MSPQDASGQDVGNLGYDGSPHGILLGLEFFHGLSSTD